MLIFSVNMKFVDNNFAPPPLTFLQRNLFYNFYIALALGYKINNRTEYI